MDVTGMWTTPEGPVRGGGRWGGREWGGHGRRGGWGGGFDLNAQIQGLNLNEMMDYALKTRLFLDERARMIAKEAERKAMGRRNDAGFANAIRRQTAEAQARAGQGSPFDQTRAFHANRMDLDRLAAQDPWGSGQAYGQGRSLGMFNFPAAAALTFGRDIFSNGFDVYSKMLASGGGANAAQQAQYGGAPTWGRGY